MISRAILSPRITLSIATIIARRLPETGHITRMSRSLCSSAVPRATEPNRIIFSGSNDSTRRFVMLSIIKSLTMERSISQNSIQRQVNSGNRMYRRFYFAPQSRSRSIVFWYRRRLASSAESVAARPCSAIARGVCPSSFLGLISAS